MENTNGWPKSDPDDMETVDGTHLFGHITIECRASRTGNLLAIICDEHAFLLVSRVPMDRVCVWPMAQIWDTVSEHLTVEHQDEIEKLSEKE